MFRILLLILFIIHPLRLFANDYWRTGDLILLPLNCILCHMIESETDSPFSHVGMVWQDPQSQRLFVFESWGTVRQVPLADFLARRERGREAAVYRFKELAELYTQAPDRFIQFQIELGQKFHRDCAGLFYDAQFLWDNRDSMGREKLYCSELATKLIQPFLRIPFPARPMTYQKNAVFWNEYFKGQIPEGLPGVAPGDFARSQLLFKTLTIREGN
ncbi:MAG: YiiX/YebB-like N1pC/P60 family cysteine hydrolase [Pseudomonadota bacterium]